MRPSPERYVSKVEKPADFDEFWDGVLAQAAGVPLNPETNYSDLRSDEDVEVYETFYDSIDDVRIAGWYCVPRGSEGKLPVILTLPGYQGEPGIPKEWARKGYAALSVAPRGKLRSNSQFNPGYPGPPDAQHNRPQHLLLQGLLRRRLEGDRLPAHPR